MKRLLLWMLLLGSLRVAGQATEAAHELIELKISSLYSPQELDELIQRLGKRGILLKFTETGYCNGRLRILKGEIIGSDGSRMSFDTQALKEIKIQLQSKSKLFGIEGIYIKKRWRKCTEPDADEAQLGELEEEPVLHQL